MVVVVRRGLDLDLLTVAADRGYRDRLQHLDAVPPRLLDDPVRELGAAYALGEAGVVVEAFGHAGLAAEALSITSVCRFSCAA